MEVENSKTVKTKKVETKKVETETPSHLMTAMAANTIREIVRTANEEGVKRENIVSLLKEDGQFVLVYYK